MSTDHETAALDHLARAQELAEASGQPQLKLQLALGAAITRALLAVAAGAGTRSDRTGS